MSKLRIIFGKHLRYLRTKAGFSQEKLAIQSELSVDFLSLVERGINSPSFESLEKISKALNLEVKDLFSFNDHGD